MANHANKIQVSCQAIRLYGSYILRSNQLDDFRSTVMMLLKVLDPEGSERRLRHRLRRRVYQNKVMLTATIASECHAPVIHRGPTMYGTRMDMIN